MKTFLVMIRNLLTALLLICMAALNLMGQRPLPGYEGVYTYGDPSSMMEYMDTCEFVFEGQVMDGFSYDVRKISFVAYNVQIKKVFRGDLDTGFVQIIRLVRIAGSSGYHVKRLSDGVFFCTRRDLGFEQQPDSVWTNKPIQRVFECWQVARYVYGKNKQTEGMSLDFGQMGGMDFSNLESFSNYFEKRGTIGQDKMMNWIQLVRQDWWRVKKNPPKKEEPFVPYDNATKVPDKTPVRIIQPAEKDSFLQEVEKHRKRMAKPQGAGGISGSVC